MANIKALRARWPASPNDLPEAALAVFAAWSRATGETIRKALEDEVASIGGLFSLKELTLGIINVGT
jgi:hypothetical protein